MTEASIVSVPLGTQIVTHRGIEPLDTGLKAQYFYQQKLMRHVREAGALLPVMKGSQPQHLPRLQPSPRQFLAGTTPSFSCPYRSSREAKTVISDPIQNDRDRTRRET